MNLKIVTGTNEKILREPALPVAAITQETRTLIVRMRAIMKEHNGIGLAANQIGKNIRLFVAEPVYGKSKNGKFYALINPEIIARSETFDEIEEGCLSVPGVQGVSKRSKTVTMTGLDEYGRKVKIKARGLLAWIFQHEMDHLNGILFVDNARTIKRAKKT